MTNRDRVIQYLKNHPEGVDDDKLAQALGFSQRQQANSLCKKLAEEGLVVRQPVAGKIHNFWAGSKITQAKQRGGFETAQPLENSDSTMAWYWEGNVQAQVIRYLVSHNFKIRSAADTKSRQRGVDIVAERDENQVWISVKGYPKRTEKTQPSTQAGHWFKDVIFDMLEYRGENQSIKLGVGLPDFPRYRSLAAKIAWVKPVVDFVYFWVQESGEVTVE
ncbi:MAG: hypothetical protein IT316_14585 [Anaerolineales bacterium]|nr:hypothetical protein [Anaerolineales bacterium]